MLEIGIGCGSLLGFMKQRGWQVFGCNLSKAVCAHVERTWSVAGHCGDVTALAEALAYDLVAMNHVLEHVRRPVDMLTEVRRGMRSGGLLHLALPNVDCWEEKFSGWNSYEPYHLLYYIPDTVRRTVEIAGFRVEGVHTHDFFSGWFLVVLRSLPGQKRKSGHQRRWSGAGRSRARSSMRIVSPWSHRASSPGPSAECRRCLARATKLSSWLVLERRRYK